MHVRNYDTWWKVTNNIFQGQAKCHNNQRVLS